MNQLRQYFTSTYKKPKKWIFVCSSFDANNDAMNTDDDDNDDDECFHIMHSTQPMELFINDCHHWQSKLAESYRLKDPKLLDYLLGSSSFWPS